MMNLNLHCSTLYKYQLTKCMGLGEEGGGGGGGGGGGCQSRPHPACTELAATPEL